MVKLSPVIEFIAAGQSYSSEERIFLSLLFLLLYGISFGQPGHACTNSSQRSTSHSHELFPQTLVFCRFLLLHNHCAKDVSISSKEIIHPLSWVHGEILLFCTCVVTEVFLVNSDGLMTVLCPSMAHCCTVFMS